MKELSNKILSKFIIKIPKDIICYYCNIRNYLLIKGVLGYQLIKLRVTVDFYILSTNNLIFLTKNYSNKNIKLKRKQIKEDLANTKKLILKSFLNVTRLSYKKLKLVGIGFKISSLNFNGLNLLKLNLGYSHSIYYKVPNGVDIKILSSTKFIISGCSSDLVSKIASQIRSYKIPDSYKGKGILYDNETVLLKEGKKVK